MQRQAKIYKCDVKNIEKLFEVFDEIVFNYNGELTANFEHDFPVLGKRIVSYYMAENHIQVFEKDMGCRESNVMMHPSTRDFTRDELLKEIMNKMKANFDKACA